MFINCCSLVIAVKGKSYPLKLAREGTWWKNRLKAKQRKYFVFCPDLHQTTYSGASTVPLFLSRPSWFFFLHILHCFAHIESTCDFFPPPWTMVLFSYLYIPLLIGLSPRLLPRFTSYFTPCSHQTICQPCFTQKCCGSFWQTNPRSSTFCSRYFLGVFRVTKEVCHTVGLEPKQLCWVILTLFWWSFHFLSVLGFLNLTIYPKQPSFCCLCSCREKLPNAELLGLQVGTLELALQQALVQLGQQAWGRFRGGKWTRRRQFKCLYHALHCWLLR